MKKIFRTTVLLFIFIAYVVILTSCDSTPSLLKLKAPEDITIQERSGNYYIYIEQLEFVDNYRLNVYEESQTSVIKRYTITSQKALTGYQFVMQPGTYYLTVISTNSEGAYADSEESEFIEFVVEPSSENINVGANDVVWNIHYELDGGSFLSYYPDIYIEGKTTTLYSPTKSGFSFLGWYTDAAFSTRITAISSITKGDITLYARWEENLVSSGEYTGYYATASNLSGNDLKMALRTIISENVIATTYANLKTYLQYTDADPKDSSKVILFFSGNSVKGAWDGGSTWNREHVWPQSISWFQTSGAGSDIHHIRPVDPTVNSTYHNNRRYGEVNGKEGKLGGVVVCWYEGDWFEPMDSYKGDTARIIFYLLTRYKESDSYSVTRVAESMDMLLEWNALDPVDDFEIRRNERSYEKQNNRNPFIDHPEFANLIWK